MVYKNYYNVTLDTRVNSS